MVTKNWKHGDASRKRKTKEWCTWVRMIARCTYPSVERYPRYGGRGIKVCPEWRASFATFLAHVGRAPSQQHSLDRIDNDGDYEPGNVRWATRSEQTKNSTKARRITALGRTQTIGEWAAETGLNRQTIQMRLDAYGFTPEEAVSRPKRLRRKR